jgi:diguanylate cyclase
MDEKIELLKKITLFSSLTDIELSRIASYCEFFRYNKGDIIFQEDSLGDEVYIIKQGEILITRHDRDGEDISLARFISGECFGELGLFRNAPRSASATAGTDVELLMFPSTKFTSDMLFETQPQISARILQKLISMIANRMRSANNLLAEKTHLTHELRQQIILDKLTGLYNRIFLDEDLTNQLQKYGEQTCMIIIKPDNFKIINDNYGHDAGDGVLKIMAKIIKAGIRETDIAARYKGDEYAVIFPDTDINIAIRLSESLRTDMYNMDVSDVIKDKNFHVTVSIGISHYPSHADDAKGLMERSYQMMMQARNSGGNRVDS